MKLRPKLIFVLLLFSCIYDPPQKGKEISIHNQTDKPIIILDSLNENYLKLYDTTMVNGRRYISRQSNYVTEYGTCQKFYSNFEMNNLKSTKFNKITLHIINSNELQNTFSKDSINNLSRSFDINIDTLKKYDLKAQFYLLGTKLTLPENNLLGQRYNQQFFT